MHFFHRHMLVVEICIGYITRQYMYSMLFRYLNNIYPEVEVHNRLISSLMSFTNALFVNACICKVSETERWESINLEVNRCDIYIYIALEN